MGRLIDGLKAAGRFLNQLGGSRRGNVAMIFALSLPAVSMMALGGVDIHRASTVRMNLQDALDAATLAAARSDADTDAEVTTVGLAALRANLQAYPDITLRTDLTTFDLEQDGTVTGSAKVDVKTLVANIVLPPYGKFMEDKLQVGVTSEVKRSSQNLEVGLVLDITGSMAGNRLQDLKDAAKELIALVVKDDQSLFYSKVALVPYSMGVNVGDYAADARGAIAGGKGVTNISWSTGSTRSITNISRGTTTTVTSSGHGFQNGDFVYITGVNGMTQVNGRVFQVSNRAANTFRLSGVVSSTYNSYSSGGTVTECQISTCGMVATSNGHGFSDGQVIYMTGLTGGLAWMNDRTFTVDAPSSNAFALANVAGPGSGSYSSGGTAWCTSAGCEYYRFTNADGGTSVHRVSTCVSERTGTNAYNDSRPAGSATYVGRNYPPASGNLCPTASFEPLSSNRAALQATVDTYAAVGSTAGQIGLAWGWYSISPNFASLYPTASRPAAYGAIDTIKVVVLMTDGEFNTPYCNGVIAANAAAGSGGADDHINCNATNGSPFAQAVSLCNGMKAQDVVVYTVGFDISSGVDLTPTVVDTAKEVMQNCATSSAHVYFPEDGSDLKDAFRAIGRDITSLRISR